MKILFLKENNHSIEPKHDNAPYDTPILGSPTAKQFLKYFNFW
jgi:hypothetical protein